ncbi:DUF3566 domain-containing protein [Demequina gelatinilytica]|uniref:DUF3566 domain-containing protein n=1 Tax=Demequina gelatinilytica TaxID=1638980 RepID=UPI000AFACB42|nr:DUF3566 domain-containing protein [Demequina gelatinilytica]
MNADDRTTSTARGLYTPRPTEPTTGQVPARRAFMPVGAETPVSTQSPTSQPAPAASAAAPTSTGSIPTRTALRPQTAPEGVPTTRPAAPQSTQQPTSQPAPQQAPRQSAPQTVRPTQPQAFAPTGVPAAPAAPATPAAPTEAPARRDGAIGTGTAVLGAGAAKVKDFAGRAADSFKAGDDLGVPTAKGGPRKARVLLSRIDPWSALKLGFLLSIAAGIMFVVAVFVLWTVLNQMGVFTLVNEWVVKLFSTDSEVDIMQFVQQNKVMGAATLVAVINVVLLTALSAIGAFLYNVVSSVVGGVYVTLTDD